MLKRSSLKLDIVLEPVKNLAKF